MHGRTRIFATMKSQHSAGRITHSGGRLIAVAADGPRPEQTLLHELGHSLDLWNVVPAPWQFSDRPEWQQLKPTIPRFHAGIVAEHRETDSHEMFADFVAAYLSGGSHDWTRAALWRFVESAINEFVGGP